jgi:hypothetical protein
VARVKSGSLRGAEAPFEGTDNSDLMEGIYIKIEDEDRVMGRMKLPRPEFEKVRSADRNSLDRPSKTVSDKLIGSESFERR